MYEHFIVLLQRIHFRVNISRFVVRDRHILEIPISKRGSQTVPFMSAYPTRGVYQRRLCQAWTQGLRDINY